MGSWVQHTTLTLIILTISILGLDGTGTLDLYVTRVRDLNEEIETLEDADGEAFTKNLMTSFWSL